MRNRELLLALVCSCLSGLSGCSAFMTQSKVESVTETVFDDRLARGIADYWKTCMSKSLIWATDKTFDLHGKCPLSTAVPSPEGQLVHAGAVQHSPYAVAIPLKLFDSRSNLADFPWPLQNCFVNADTEVTFYVIGFETLTATWVQHNDMPSLKLAFANPPATNGYRPAIRSTIATASCPSPINQAAVRAKLDKSKINGLGNITFQQMNIDVYLVYATKDDKITVTTDVVPKFTGLDTGIDWNKLPDSAKGKFEKQIGSLDDTLADQLKGQFSALGPVFADAMNRAYPTGHQICDLEIRSGTFVIVSDSADARSDGRPCLRQHIG
jgi:hypothetical protein